MKATLTTLLLLSTLASKATTIDAYPTSDDECPSVIETCPSAIEANPTGTTFFTAKNMMASGNANSQTTDGVESAYTPTAENLAAREAFAEKKFGIFLHWGIYSMFAQGEWYMQNAGINWQEYAKAADGFYPHRFNAREWVRAIKNAGAGYICLTSRHHDGFSMWDTKESDYNIVKATPFKRDVIKELAEACHEEGIKLHLYYSHLDWTREDYPWGRTGRNTGKDPRKQNWPSYSRFMNQQLTELLTRYGEIGAIWFDGYWDHDKDTVPFDWQLRQQYDLIHRLQPSCLIGNNHHEDLKPGEDIQIFERDLPGENTAGFVEEAAKVSQIVPLETCETMNGMWGYKVTDQNYKSAKDIVRLLVRTSGLGANLLLNIGPQPNGELPATALQRLAEVGEWLKRYGETIYATTAGPVKPTPDLSVTRKGKKLYCHVMKPSLRSIDIPMKEKVLEAKVFENGQKLTFKHDKKQGRVVVDIPEHEDCFDYVVTLTTK